MPVFDKFPNHFEEIGIAIGHQDGVLPESIGPLLIDQYIHSDIIYSIDMEDPSKSPTNRAYTFSDKGDYFWAKYLESKLGISETDQPSPSTPQHPDPDISQD